MMDIKLESIDQSGIRKIGILSAGGDAPGMNAAIRAVVRTASPLDIEVMGIMDGYEGIIQKRFTRLKPRSVAHIIERGGTMIGTSRYPDFTKLEIRQQAISILKRDGFDALITLGGDGTFRGATALSKEGGIRVVGIPTTIDNDVWGTDYTVGFDTAINTAMQSIDKIRDTASSLEKLYFVEVMGRSRGFIALYTGIAGGADAILIPETETDILALSATLQRRFANGKKAAIVIVAEGDIPGGAMEVGRQVGAALKEDYRVCVLGHVQRGGAPTARDRILASRLGAAAVSALINGQHGNMVGEVAGRVMVTPLSETWKRTKELDCSLTQLLDVLST
jgi:6-phosphofructokinase 1